MQFKSKIIKAGKDRKGNTRKFISVPQIYNNDFELGEVVEIRKLHNKKETRAPNPDPDPNALIEQS